MKKFGLGKGLGSLIPPKILAEKEILSRASSVAQGLGDRVLQVDIHKIIPNPDQPRKQFSQEGLEELADSIREYGILQPLIAMKDNDTYQLIAGERRLRAAKLAGLHAVPLIVREAKRQEQLELSLLENVQRHDLNPIEEAIAYQRLIDEFNLTQEELSQKIGKSRPVIANMLRLLQLPEEIQKALSENKISYSVARIIIGLPEAERMKFFQKILKNGLTVSEADNEAKKYFHRRVQKIKDPKLSSREDELQHALGTKIAIKKSGSGGQIVIYFYSDEELGGIMKKICRN